MADIRAGRGLSLASFPFLQILLLLAYQLMPGSTVWWVQTGAEDVPPSDPIFIVYVTGREVSALLLQCYHPTNPYHSVSHDRNELWGRGLVPWREMNDFGRHNTTCSRPGMFIIGLRISEKSYVSHSKISTCPPLTLKAEKSSMLVCLQPADRLFMAIMGCRPFLHSQTALFQCRSRKVLAKKNKQKFQQKKDLSGISNLVANN